MWPHREPISRDPRLAEAWLQSVVAEDLSVLGDLADRRAPGWGARLHARAALRRGEAIEALERFEASLEL